MDLDLESQDALVMDHGAPLTARINSDPIILRGLTGPEVLIAYGVSFIAVLCVCLFLLTLIELRILILFQTALPFLLVWWQAGKIASLKRDRPDYYYNHLARRKLAQFGLVKDPFIHHNGDWTVGLDIGSLSPPVKAATIAQDVTQAAEAPLPERPEDATKPQGSRFARGIAEAGNRLWKAMRRRWAQASHTEPNGEEQRA